MSDPVIVAARRTAVVARGGGFQALQIHQLAAPVITDLLQDAGLVPDDVDEIILGNALGGGGNPARITALQAGLPLKVAGLTIDRQCSSGIDAVLLAEALIRSGRHEVVIAGGAESYSRRPLRLRTDPNGKEPVPYDQPPFTPWPDRDPDMAFAAEALALHMNISRHEQDEWAITSHERALAASVALEKEITPVCGIIRDSFTRRMSMRICSRAAVIVGSITAANTAVAADGAGLCLLVSAKVAQRLTGPKLGILSGATLGADPELPGLGPVPAIKQVLQAASVRAADLTAVELMEAFAVQAIACARLTDLPLPRINRGGGALARGHPIAASGAINLVRLFHELDQKGQIGLAAIAAAGGIGSAVLLKKLA